MVAATAIEGCTGKDDPVECCQIEPGSAEAIASYCGKSCYQVLQAAWISRLDLKTPVSFQEHRGFLLTLRLPARP